jgi:hypothetical protein
MEDTSRRLVNDRVVDEDGKTQLVFSCRNANEKERIIIEISNDVMES